MKSMQIARSQLSHTDTIKTLKKRRKKDLHLFCGYLPLILFTHQIYINSHLTYFCEVGAQKIDGSENSISPVRVFRVCV